MADEDLDLDSYWKVLRPSKKGGRGRALRLEGRKFGRLLVLERRGTDKYGSATWVCQCLCGKVRVVARRELTSGNVKSCGCLLKEYQSQPKEHLISRRVAYIDDDDLDAVRPYDEDEIEDYD